MSKCLVIAGYERLYESPIIGMAGDVVKIVRRDDDAPGWVWCEHVASAGWVPEAFLDRQGEQSAAVLRRDYSALELTVVVGQTLEVSETVDGWSWCSRPGGDAGWVPTHKLSAA